MGVAGKPVQVRNPDAAKIETKTAPCSSRRRRGVAAGRSKI